MIPRIKAILLEMPTVDSGFLYVRGIVTDTKNASFVRVS